MDPWTAVQKWAAGLAGEAEPANDLLVVSYAFPPFLDASGIVAAKRLVKWGEPFDLITHSLAPHTPIDPRLGELVAPLVGRMKQVAGKPRVHREASLAAWCRAGLTAVLARENQAPPYRRMYSLSAWPASQVLAALLKARQPSLRWTAEVFEPFLADSWGEVRDAPLWDHEVAAAINRVIEGRGLPVVSDRGFLGWAEAIVFALADEIIVANTSQRGTVANPPERAGGSWPAALAQRADGIMRVEPHPPSLAVGN